MKTECAPIVFVTYGLAEKTAKLLSSFAVHRPFEGVVYWFGIESGDRAVVTTLVVPDANTEDGSVRTSVEANAEATGVIAGTPLVLLGQAHSHPGRYVSHSVVDDEETFACFPGSISVVVPWFGRYGLRLEECGIHRHLGGKFRMVRNVEEHIRMLPEIVDFRRAITEGEVHGA
jgi:hypothetical protein